MKALIFKISVVIIIIAFIAGLFLYINKLKNEVDIAEKNRIATVELYDSEKDKVFALNLKIEDLDRIKNEQIQQMDSIRKCLKIKDKQLKALYNSKSSADIIDTIRIPIYERDSIFDNCYLDTCIGDPRWYDVCVNQIDSGLVILSTHFSSDLTLIASEKKEIIGKPRKTWIGRLFQKKTKALSVTTVEQNPYVKNDSTVFVIPIK